MNTLDQLMNVIDGGRLERREVLDNSFALYALAISLLEPEERERVLAEVECGRLRSAVGQFDRPSPYPRTGNEGLQ
jgi:hypothetical protein